MLCLILVFYNYYIIDPEIKSNVVMIIDANEKSLINIDGNLDHNSKNIGAV